MGKAKKIGIGIGIFIIILFGLGILIGVGFNEQERALKEPELTSTQIKSRAMHNLSWDELMRDNENYVGQIIYLEGKIVQTQNLFSDTYVLRISLEGPFYIDDIVWVNYAGERVLEEDLVRFWGKVKGIRDYTAVLGNIIQVPEIDSMILEVVQKQG